MHFLRSRNVYPLVLWEIRVERASGILIALNPAWVPRPWRNCWRHRLPFPGRKYMLSQVEPENYRAIMCDPLQGYQRGAPYSLARSWERENPVQNVCMLQNGSFCEGVRLISTWLLAPYVWVSRCTDWIVDRYHRHWSLCRGHCRVRSPQSGQSFGKKTTSPMSTFVSALGPGSGVRALSLQPLGF